MDNSQKKIFEWLKEQDECIGRLYEAAVRMVEDDSFPGRNILICHAIREIRNRLPEIVGAKGIIKRADYTKEVEELAGLWKSEGVQSVYQKDNEDREPVAEYRVSGKFLEQVKRLVNGHIEVKGRKKHNAKQLLMALETENNKWEATLGPVVKLWVDETEWFVERAHIGKAIDYEELIGHFERFESVLLSLKGYFYEGMDKIKEIVESANSSDVVPNGDEIAKIVALLGRPNYRIYFFKELKNPYWLEPLKNQGFFRIPDNPQKGEAYDRWLEEWYLETISEKVPEKVLDVIKDVKCENPYVRSGCIKCLLKMPLETASRSNKVIKNILKQEFIKGEVDWLWIGQNCAELMVKMLDKFPASAFKIAWALLDARVSEEKTYGKDIAAKFSGHDYRELMLEYYKKVWEAKPERAIGLLIKILDRCLVDLDKEGKGEEGYDASRYFGYGLELGDLNEIDMKHPGIKTILVKGICEAGKVLIDKKPGKVSELLDWLEGTNRVIFLRIVMYLLRFVKPGTEKERISKFVGNKEYFKEYNPCWNEHRRLLNDKFDDVSDKDRDAFLKWVDEDKYSEDQRKEFTERYKKNNEAEPDFEKWENFAKAEELYLVRERFKAEYERYKKAAGVKNDSELAPRKMVSEARYVDPKEGTPLSAEDMANKTCDEVLDYLLEPKNYEGEKRVSGWGTAKEALAATFRYDVKKRGDGYLDCDVEKLKKLSASFLTGFFYGMDDIVREGSFNKQKWELLINFASLVVEEKHAEQEYKYCFSEILSVLREGFGRGKGELELDESIARKFWGILKKLIHFPVENMGDKNVERDPMQLMLRHVAGKTLELTVLLGVACKNKFPEYWEKELKTEMRKCWEYVLKNIREPGINCIFGIEFSRIHWLDTEWIEKNLDLIFNDELWDEVWGTYTSWGRPSPNGFKLLVGKGKYERAIDMLGAKNTFKYGKDPENGLVEHLMIGYFNGWVDLESDILKQFFKKASAELRGEAARFLTTGFKSVKEEGKPYDEIAERMRAYWKERLAALKGKPKENEKEAIGLTGWVEDSVLPAKETLELLEQSLKLSGGKVGEMRNARNFIEGINKFGKGNELLTLQCLKKAAADENMHYPWSRIEEPLVSFLETIVDLSEEVRNVGKEVVDLYGRYNPDKFRGVWEKLNVKRGKMEKAIIVKPQKDL
jgi:hypothetical protein